VLPALRSGSRRWAFRAPGGRVLSKLSRRLVGRSAPENRLTRLVDEPHLQRSRFRLADDHPLREDRRLRNAGDAGRSSLPCDRDKVESCSAWPARLVFGSVVFQTRRVRRDAVRSRASRRRSLAGAPARSLQIGSAEGSSSHGCPRLHTNGRHNSVAEPANRVAPRGPRG
jgi:hypothetical protein